jgi:hypothetical protein
MGSSESPFEGGFFLIRAYDSEYNVTGYRTKSESFDKKR